MGESMGKTMKGNQNIFGIETKNNAAASKFNEFDDLDDDEDDRDDGSDEEPNHDSPAGKSHDKANANKHSCDILSNQKSLQTSMNS